MTTATTLNGAINSAVTSLIVRDVLGFPSAGDFRVTIGTERLTVTGGQGTLTWTVARGADSTTAASHIDGSAVYLYQDSYATIDDLLATMGQTITDTTWLANASQKLVEATKDLDREIGFSALRATGTRIVHSSGGNVLHVHGGIVSLTGIEVRYATGQSFVALQAQDTGWFLEGNEGDPNASDGVYYHVRLIDIATYPEWPDLKQAVRLTGTLGGDPDSRKAACVAWARQRIALDPSMPGGYVSGPEDLGGAVSLDRWPRLVYDLIYAERHRFWCHI